MNTQEELLLFAAAKVEEGLRYTRAKNREYGHDETVLKDMDSFARNLREQGIRARNKEVCPMCDKGTLTAMTYDDVFVNKEFTVLVTGLEGNTCNNCKGVSILTPQILRNQEKITKAIQQQDAEVKEGFDNLPDDYETGDY